MEPRHRQHKKNERTDNYICAAEFRHPKWIPCSVSIMPATWKKYREDVEKIVLDHPKVFPGYKKGARNFDDVGLNHREGGYTDNWGCVWANIYEGLAGQVVGHPLENWDALETYKAPDPLTQGDRGPQVNWETAKENIKRAKQNGNLASGGLSHGFMFMRLFYLRGFENLMIDIATDDHRLKKLIDLVLDHNMKLVNKWLELGVELVSGGDDLGTQKGLPISPRHFRKYLTPCYAQIFGTCRDAGALVYLHTDGHIMEVMDDLIECGVTIINPQIRPNTFEELAKTAKGKVCINLDLDRQLFPFATPQAIKNHIKKAIDVLGADEGGLMLHAECEPDVPLENIETICNAFEEWCGPTR